MMERPVQQAQRRIDVSKEGEAMVGRKKFVVEHASDQAMRVFWERGPATTSISDLVVGTGLSRSSLYATYGDREDLLLTCLDRYAHSVASSLLDALRSAPDDPVAALRAMYSAILARMADRQCPTGCLITLGLAEVTALSPRVAAAVRALHSDQVIAVRSALQSGLDHGWRHDRDLDVTAAYLVGTAQTLAILHRAGTDIETLRGIAETTLVVLG
jgi:AcrR family transcriptional regulator